MSILKNYWRTILVVSAIIFLSVMSSDTLPSKVTFHRHFDKFAHFSMYFALSFVFFIENYKSSKPIRKGWIVLDTISLGIGLEFAQLLLTNDRSANFYDAVFNTIGVICGSILFFSLRNYNFIYRIMLFKKVYNK